MNNFIQQFKIKDPFWAKYQTLLTDVVIPYQEAALRDEIPDADKSHAIENFEQAAKVLETGSCDEEFYGMVFQDSDVAKWLEAAAYSLIIKPDAELEKRMDDIIALIGRAQYPDGYLNTYFTVKEPDRKWTNLQEAHELYCAGHMMEAAVAYYEATGKRSLLDIMCRMADHIYTHFIEEGAEGYPGHPEVELALMRMYRATGNARYLELSKHFVDVRGVDPDYFVKEAAAKDWCVWGMDANDRAYAQNQAPVRELTEATGHSVRAVYLYTAMADQAASDGDEALKQACETLWNNITEKRMYITAGIGSTVQGEAFTKDYDLPNDTAYAETCASIGLMFFARKMLDLSADSRYSDVMERALYNTVLAGMQLDGKRFFYVNPLEVVPGIAGEAVTHRHDLPVRPKWFGCACCPPNVSRTITSIANYAWGVEEDIVYSHLYTGGTLELDNAQIVVTTRYPYEGAVKYQVIPKTETAALTLAIRIPDWSENTHLLINGEETEIKTEKGYVYIRKEFTADDSIELLLDMEPKRYYANPDVSDVSGMVAIQRGPLVYCAEGVDNDMDVLSLRIAAEGAILVQPYDAERLSGTTMLEVDGYRLAKTHRLYTLNRPKAEPCKIRMVPYYTWANRGLNQMRVWLPEM